MKRNLLLFVMLMTMSVSVYSQGIFIKLGMSSSSYWGENSEGSRSKSGFMFCAGMESQIGHSDLYVAPAFELISKGCRGKDYDNSSMTINAVYLEIPIDFLYHLRLFGNNYATFAAGPYMAYGLGGDMGSDGGYTVTTFDDRTGFDRMDVGLNFGLGYEYNNILLNASCDLGLKKVASDSPKNLAIIISMGFKI